MSKALNEAIAALIAVGDLPGAAEPVNEFETPESISLVNRLWAEHRLLSWAC